MKSYTCNACGAEIIVNDNSSFTTCLYCGNNIAINIKEINDLNIKKIIPFTVEKDEVKQKYSEILNTNIIDAKKVYVPVRYCNCEFDHLMYYQYVVHDSEHGDNYHDIEELIDGTIENEIVFGNSKVTGVNYKYKFSEKERLNFDPILLKDVSIEYAKFDNLDEIEKKLEYNVCDYSRRMTKREINKIYSQNYFITDIDLEPFSTLLPVYILKSSRGIIFNVPGIDPDAEYKNAKKRNELNEILSFMFITEIIVVISLFVVSNNNRLSDLDSIENILKIIAICIPFFLIFLFPRTFSLRIFDNRFYNYGSKTYTYGKRGRKKVRY